MTNTSNQKVSNGMNPVVHFEMPYENKNRMEEFYKQSFGWKSNEMGPDYGGYVVMHTSEIDEKTKYPKSPGRINGGFFPKSKDNQYPSVVIAVDNIREAMKKIELAGGKILGGMKPGEPDDIPGVGLYIAFLDTEGNRASIIEPKGM